MAPSSKKKSSSASFHQCVRKMVSYICHYLSLFVTFVTLSLLPLFVICIIAPHRSIDLNSSRLSLSLTFLLIPSLPPSLPPFRSRCGSPWRRRSAAVAICWPVDIRKKKERGSSTSPPPPSRPIAVNQLLQPSIEKRRKKRKKRVSG